MFVTSTPRVLLRIGKTISQLSFEGGTKSPNIIFPLMWSCCDNLPVERKNWG
jgi:hypothetical protein